ncbi:hypothetical protein EJ074_10450 [Mesorhizobium sp. M3A.F.Ca.ET.080.04.2.1]|nr:hypothetical protein EJ074_10450 [Mesorhizobium sp. M3A.F.Ca.ET.080.04.2.1]RWB66925.1 MAG: hypothetical protein EOQ49_27020 [Mesorhizobium sp.]RWB87625.1 MAG: hypothetical protein EOQ52_15575 [Mesorhizobium sp.]RWE38100.1 MAG: hypothetical protein EOS77_00400 [Mesorhizobium sp.]RWF23036.1 MAG: hypothetical protein EOS64_12905 [Mesorhizobium sp.]
MRAIPAAHGQSERKVVVADSFEGLPPPNGNNIRQTSVTNSQRLTNWLFPWMT